MERTRWREHFRSALGQMAESERCRLGAIIADKIRDLPEYREAGKIMVYLSGQAEVPTEAIVATALCTGKTVAGPGVDPARRGMEARRITDPTADVAIGPYGLSQVLAGREVLVAAELDLILVPGLGFDQAGNRLGHGAGYYDRFLRGLGGKKVALAFDLQVVPELPAEAWDVPMDVIVTENRIIRRNP